MQASQYPFAPMRKRMPPCTKVHLRWQHYEMGLPRSSTLQKSHVHCPYAPFLPTSSAARRRAREAPRGAGASNLLRVSHHGRALRLCEPAAATPPGPALLSTGASHMRAASHQSGKHMIGSFTGLSAGSIEARSDKRPPARPCMHYQILWLSHLASKQRGPKP